MAADAVSSEDRAIIAVLKARAANQHKLNDLILLYGDRLPISQACYQSAISNFIEDTWNKTSKVEGCESTDTLCDKDPKAQENLVQHLKMSGRSIDNNNDKKEGISFANNWYVSSQLLNIIEIMFAPDDHKKRTGQAVSLDQSKKPLDKYNGYINSCSKMQPVSWSEAGKLFDAASSPSINALKLGAENLLIDYAVASQIPAEKEAIHCAGVLIRAREKAHESCKDKICADTVIADDKQTLIKWLDELKSHQCDLSYAYQMVPKGN